MSDDECGGHEVSTSASAGAALYDGNGGSSAPGDQASLLFDVTHRQFDIRWPKPSLDTIPGRGTTTTTILNVLKGPWARGSSEVVPDMTESQAAPPSSGGGPHRHTDGALWTAGATASGNLSAPMVGASLRSRVTPPPGASDGGNSQRNPAEAARLQPTASSCSSTPPTQGPASWSLPPPGAGWHRPRPAAPYPLDPMAAPRSTPSLVPQPMADRPMTPASFVPSGPPQGGGAHLAGSPATGYPATNHQRHHDGWPTTNVTWSNSGCQPQYHPTSYNGGFTHTNYGMTMAPPQFATPAPPPPARPSPTPYPSRFPPHAYPNYPYIGDDQWSNNMFTMDCTQYSSGLEHINQRIISSALMGELVQLDELLCGSIAENDDFKPTIDMSGNIQIKVVKSKRQINSLYKWLEAWGLYERILVPYYGVNVFNEMSRYRGFLLSLSSKYKLSPILNYDAAHRTRLSARRSMAFYSAVDYHCFITTFDSSSLRTGQKCQKCSSFDHSTSECFSGSAARGQGRPNRAAGRGDVGRSEQYRSGGGAGRAEGGGEACWSFQSGNCRNNQCKRRHACYLCGGPEGLDKCSRCARLKSQSQAGTQS